jgi:L-asparaginase
MSSKKSGKPRIALFATGGTIASSAGSEAQLRDYCVTDKIEDMLAAVPLVGDRADIEPEQICNVESHKIGDEILFALAAKVRRACERSDIDGVVITHGTDTLEETAYFLHLAIPTDKPIVLVGAMRPATALSADGPLNLLQAVCVASHPVSRAQGVLIVMNDRILSARHATKTHTSAVDAFNAAEFGCLGLVSGEEVRFQNRLSLRHTTTSEVVFDENIGKLPEVDIIYDHQGAGTHHFQASIARSIGGIVLAATGQGSLSPQALDGVMQARQAGLAVVRASRVWQGAVSHVQKDKSLGLVAAQTLNPAMARILLRLALVRAPNLLDLQRIFDTH